VNSTADPIVVRAEKTMKVKSTGDPVMMKMKSTADPMTMKVSTTDSATPQPHKKLVGCHKYKGKAKSATKNKNCRSNLLKKNMSTHAYKELHTCPIQMH